MSEYIKREDAMAAVDKCRCDTFQRLDGMKGYLTAIPLADVVEVVRCKECKWWNKDENVLNRGICDEWSDFEDGISRYTGVDDYCSYGEEQEHD